MSELFIAVLNMSLSASFVAIAVMLLRLVLKRTPKIFSYALWAIVLFRLICPFSFESALSLLAVRPDAVPQDIVYVQNPAIESGVGFVDNAVNRTIENSLPPAKPEASVNPMGIVVEIGAYIWLIGILIIVGYGVFSYVRLQMRLTNATPVEDNIYETDRVSTPFVMGFLRPRIFLPLELADEEREYILRHEWTHIRRKDYLIKPLGFLALALHWFNPLVWLSYRLMCRDMEMSCDERVLVQYGEDIRAKYSGSLLSLSMKQSGLLAPLAFGESDAKSRIKNVLHYKKPVFWVSIAAVVALAVAGFCLLANPVKSGEYVNRYPEDARISFMNKTHDDIQIKDGSGNDISHIAIDLWYAANEVYNVDDVVMFEMGESEVSLAQYPGPNSNELINYQTVVENVFTENGIAQLERTAIGGNAPLIRKIGDKVYRMGAWKTGYSYGYAMESMETKEIVGERITITARYEIHPGYVIAYGDPDYVPEYEYVDFTIAKVGGKWLVDDYIYPEAYRDYQGLTKEEYEDLQAQKARYEAMTDEQKQIAREGGTVGCINFTHLWWEESIEMSFIRYVGEDAFNEWVGTNADDGCHNIYSFADRFGLDFETLKTIITENRLEEIYPLDRLETRYNYFHPANSGQDVRTYVTFPVNDGGQTEFSAAIYEMEPFDLYFNLPNGWTFSGWGDSDTFNLIGVFSRLNIFNENSECVGAVGCNLYEPYEGAGDDPRAIYNQIALGNNYHFDVRDSYEIITKTDSGETAVCDVYYSANVNGGSEKTNKGIVSYNKDLLVYIAMEFANDKVTDEQIINMAKSTQIKDSAFTGVIAKANEDKEEILKALQDMITQYRAGTVVNNEFEPRFDALPADAKLRDLSSVDDFAIEVGNEMFWKHAVSDKRSEILREAFCLVHSVTVF